MASQETKVNPDGVAKGLSAADLQKRAGLVKELINTEENYVEDLRIIIEVFMQPLKEILTKQETAMLFSNVEALLPINESLIKSLRDADAPENIGRIFVEKGDLFKIYAVYCSNQPNLASRVREYSKKYKAFADLVEKSYDNPRCRSLGLDSFLIAPMQRLTKYPIFLSEISRKTLPSHADYENLMQSHKLIKEIVDLINERTRVVEKIDRLTVLQNKLIDFEFNLVDKNRDLLQQGQLMDLRLKSSQSPNGGPASPPLTLNHAFQSPTFYSFLFNDFLLFTLETAEKKYAVKKVVHLMEDYSKIVVIDDVEWGEAQPSILTPRSRAPTNFHADLAFQIICTKIGKGKEKKFKLQAASKADRDLWVNNFRLVAKAIADHQEHISSADSDSESATPRGALSTSSDAPTREKSFNLKHSLSNLKQKMKDLWTDNNNSGKSGEISPRNATSPPLPTAHPHPTVGAAKGDTTPKKLPVPPPVARTSSAPQQAGDRRSGSFLGQARMSVAPSAAPKQLTTTNSPSKPMPPPRPLRSRSSVVRQQLSTVDELKQENRLLKTALVELFDLYDATESINRRLLELNTGNHSKDLDLLTILTQIPMFDKSIEKAVEILYRDSKNVEDPSLPVFNTEKKALIEKMYDKVKQLSDLDTSEAESLSLTSTPREEISVNDTPTKPTPPPKVVRTPRDEPTGPPAPPPKINREQHNSAPIPQPVLIRNVNSADGPITLNSSADLTHSYVNGNITLESPVGSLGRDRSSTIASGLLLGNARATFSRNSMEIESAPSSTSSNTSSKEDENNNNDVISEVVDENTNSTVVAAGSQSANNE
eukprot:TRINITY_DN2639_c0_g2_i1.p1 TRINITY_DN2639_c0_g2~~TRINITY_DN2639_c0_g2_i1.p1  ORF type:complete len:823 (+),score=141.59 TRINITY_DN2639_c0_g2_i1:47-2515(+)